MSYLKRYYPLLNEDALQAKPLLLPYTGHEKSYQLSHIDCGIDNPLLVIYVDVTTHRK